MEKRTPMLAYDSRVTYESRIILRGDPLATLENLLKTGLLLRVFGNHWSIMDHHETLSVLTGGADKVYHHSTISREVSGVVKLEGDAVHILVNERPPWFKA